MQNVKNEQQVYVGLGSNLGDSEAILLSAVRCIEAIPGVTEVKVSFFYQTPPISDIPQPDYLNAVCSFRTLLKPRDLFSCLQAIENGHGRLAKPKNAPRRIDLDILFYGNESYDDGDLKIPHPHWRERLFLYKKEQP